MPHKEQNDGMYSLVASGSVTGENLRVRDRGPHPKKKLPLGLQLIIAVIRLPCQTVRPCALGQRDLLLS